MNKKKVLCILSIAFIGLFIVALIMFGCYNQSVNAGAEEIPVTDTEKDTNQLRMFQANRENPITEGTTGRLAVMLLVTAIAMPTMKLKSCQYQNSERRERPVKVTALLKQFFIASEKLIVVVVISF